MIERIAWHDKATWLRIERRFWKYVSPEPNTGCWIWTGAAVPDGYGHMFIGGGGPHTMKAHRVSWMLHHGDPGDLQVLHRCDNPWCVNPEHLFLGTNDTNVADRVRKGRSARPTGPDHHSYIDGRSMLIGKRGIARGERVASAKLTTVLVMEIRSDERSTYQIAKALGISQSLVWQVKTRKVWRHVD